MKKLLILGAGGHSKVVADAAMVANQWSEIAFLDDHRYHQLQNSPQPEKHSTSFGPILGPLSALDDMHRQEYDVHIAIGDNQERLKLLSKIKTMQFNLATIIHPSAVVSKTAKIGSGTAILANTTVNPDARIGEGVIINTGAVIEHDCILSDCVHISPNATLAGGASVGEASWVGMGSNVLQNVAIGMQTVIGAGAVVINDIPSGVVALGVPAKIVNIHKVELNEHKSTVATTI